MNLWGIVIFDAFNTSVMARQDSEGTFLAGLAKAGLEATASALARLQAASEVAARSGAGRRRVPRSRPAASVPAFTADDRSLTAFG